MQAPLETQLKLEEITMKKSLSLLATLALATTLSFAVYAQNQDPQPNSQPGSDQPLADTQTQNSFVGTIVQVGNQYVLKTDKMTYQLDDQTKAKQFEGKQVNVSGTLDKSTSVIRITDIQPAS